LIPCQIADAGSGLFLGVAEIIASGSATAVERIRTVDGTGDGDVDNQTHNTPVALAAGYGVFLSGTYEAA